VNAQRGNEGVRFLNPWFACPHALQIIGLSNPFLSLGPRSLPPLKLKAEKQRRIYVPHELLRKRRGKFLGCLDHASLTILGDHPGRDACVARVLEYFIISPCWRKHQE